MCVGVATVCLWNVLLKLKHLHILLESSDIIDLVQKAVATCIQNGIKKIIYSSILIKSEWYNGFTYIQLNKLNEAGPTVAQLEVFFSSDYLPFLCFIMVC